METYTIELHFDEVDGDWIATVPDLGPGVSAFGETPADALREIQLVIPAVIQTLREAGEPVPEPRHRPMHAA